MSSPFLSLLYSTTKKYQVLNSECEDVTPASGRPAGPYWVDERGHRCLFYARLEGSGVGWLVAQTSEGPLSAVAKPTLATIGVNPQRFF